MDYSGLISIVQIEGVRLVDALIKTTLARPDEAGELQAGLGHTVLVVPSPSPDKLAYRVLFSFSITPKAIDQKATPPGELVTIKAAFELTYGLPPGSDRPGQKIIEDFGNANVLFNAWPYWREFVNSSLGRMALPAFVLPVLRINTGPEHKVEAAAEHGPV